MSLLATPLRRALVALLSLAASASAQSPTSPISHLDDAAPIPAGMLRLSIANVWTRYDQRFAAGGGSVPLGNELSADSLGSAQFPRLLPIEAGLRTLATDPALRLSLGRLHVGSNARIVTTPIALEYGVTRRFSIGVLIPIVETRRVAQATVSGDSTRANVGYVPTSARAQAASANALVYNAYKRAADSLGVLLTNCPSNPGASGCAAVNANPTDAAATRQRAQSFADAVTTLGTTADQAIIAPRKSSDLADTLDARRTQLNVRLQQYLGASAGATTGIFTAQTDFSYIDLNGRSGVPAFLGGPLGGGLDSIHTTERINFGDIAIGAQLLVFDQFQSDSGPRRRLQTRLAIGGAVRLPSSKPDSALSLVDIGTGDGAGVEVHSLWDVILGHFGATIGARYAKSFARTVQAPLVNDPEAVYPYPLFGPRARTAGDVFGLDVTPRLLLTDWLALDGHYGLERVGPTTYSAVTITPIDPCAACQALLGSTVDAFTGTSRTAQRYGVGLRYSTVDAFARGQARYPVEVKFAHLETASGDAGLPKQTRDQIEVRLYYQLRAH
jgi:hypothetical protein